MLQVWDPDNLEIDCGKIRSKILGSKFVTFRSDKLEIDCMHECIHGLSFVAPFHDKRSSNFSQM
jgi:hypothetical protein